MAKIPLDVANSLDKITKYLISFGKNADVVVDTIKKYFKSESGNGAIKNENVNAVRTSINKIGECIEAFKSKDVTKIILSLLNVTKNISKLIPLAGPFIGAACSLFSAILGTFGSGGKKTSMADVVKEVIEEALDNYEDSELRAMVEGTMRVYIDSLAFLNFEVGAILTEGEVCSLPNYVPIYAGINMLGILTSKVKDSANKKDLPHGQRAIAYTNLYVKLAVLRSTILIQMQSVIRSSGHSINIVEGLKRVANEEEKRDKEFIKYLTQPTHDMAFLFVQLSPSKEPLLSAFMLKHELQFQSLEGLTTGMHAINTMKWPLKDIRVDVSEFRLFGIGEPIVFAHMQGLEYSSRTPYVFSFEAVNAEDSIFYISTNTSPKMYMNMDDSTVELLEHKYISSRWKIIQFEDGHYMISQANRFVYMKWLGNLNSRRSDPGSEGYWSINKK